MSNYKVNEKVLTKQFYKLRSSLPKSSFEFFESSWRRILSREFRVSLNESSFGVNITVKTQNALRSLLYSIKYVLRDRDLFRGAIVNSTKESETRLYQYPNVNIRLKKGTPEENQKELLSIWPHPRGNSSNIKVQFGSSFSISFNSILLYNLILTLSKDKLEPEAVPAPRERPEMERMTYHTYPLKMTLEEYLAKAPEEKVKLQIRRSDERKSLISRGEVPPPTISREFGLDPIELKFLSRKSQRSDKSRPKNQVSTDSPTETYHKQSDELSSTGRSALLNLLLKGVVSEEEVETALKD